MKLESEGRPAILDAQAGDVYAAVSALALPGHSFLILTRTRTSYVQVAMQAGERFVLEYREDGPLILRSAREDFSRTEVAQLLESYAAGGDAWRAGIPWRPVEDMAPRPGWDTVSNACAFLAVVVLLIGERPGLATAESLSAYMAFRPTAGHTDADRNLISNIHARGVPVEAAAGRIVNFAARLIELGRSGATVKEELPHRVDRALPANLNHG